MFEVHRQQIAKWKKQAVAALPQVFARRPDTVARDQEALEAALGQETGQRKVELDWLPGKRVVVDLSTGSNRF